MVAKKKDTTEETTENCDKNKTYQVVLTLNEKKISVYINGKNVKELSQNSIFADDILNITYFYFGADSDAQGRSADESHVTITNVLLYNRAFNEGEVNKSN